MCGIAGFVTRSDSPNMLSVLKRMTSAIAHRGPDGNGYYTDDLANLGHRRLSIIDLATGTQPMTNETENLWIVYNGEVFNHAALRPALEQAGHRYATRCDTETILHAYEEHGADCVKSFRGMFAFAIWDKSRRRLFCARDRLGIKPFYYYWNGRLFAFASEIKALLEHPQISAALNERLLPEYLAFGFGSSEETLFAGIRKLMPGHSLTLSLEGSQPNLEIRQYWDIPRPERLETRSDADWIRECRERLEQTVQMRLMSDVPLGMFLSGGVDSSAIAAIMTRLVDDPVETFSVGYAEAQFSELSYARQVAETLGTRHEEVRISMEDFFNALPRLIWNEDEPITWPSSVSLYFVSDIASRRVKVVLTGEGSDELFGGYERYAHYLFNQRCMKAYRFLPAPIRRLVRGNIETTPLLSASLRRKLGHTFLGRDENFESVQLDNFYCAFSARQQESILAGSLDSGSPYANYMRYWNASSPGSTLSRMLYADSKTYLVELLMKQDRMSMACSIESRVPFLDHPFVEFAAGVPDHMKIRGGEQKYILKRAVEDLLPRNIVYRKKMGFPTPLRQWMLDGRAEPLYANLRSRDGLLAAHCNMDAVNTLLDRHLGGVEDATDRIWRLLNIQLWGDIFLTGKSDARSAGLLTAAGTAR